VIISKRKKPLFNGTLLRRKAPGTKKLFPAKTFALKRRGKIGSALYTCDLSSFKFPQEKITEEIAQRTRKERKQ